MALLILLSKHEEVSLLVPGFRSRTRFINVDDVFKMCTYASEIIDRGLGARPLFQVIVYTFVANRTFFLVSRC